jgi:PAS domain S-box-containing protein
MKGEKKWYEDLMENMIEGCQIIGFDWRYLYLNDNAVKHSRRKKKELLGRTMMDAYPGIEKTEMFENLRLCMERRISICMQNKFAFPDGKEGWFDLVVKPVPEGILVLSLDITKQKEAETELIQQNATTNAINQIYKEALLAETEEDFSKACLAIARKQTGSKHGFICRINKHGRPVIDSISSEEVLERKIQDCEDLLQSFPPSVMQILNEVYGKRKSFILNNLQPERNKPGENFLKIENFLGIPLKQRSEVTGIIGLANKDGNYDKTDVRVMKSMATAIERALIHKRSELKMKHLYSLQSVIRRINEEILKTRDERSLFKQICGHLTEIDYIRFAWIGIIREGAVEIIPAAWAGFENGYLSAIKVTQDDSEYGKGPVGMAIKTKQPSVIEDIVDDPRFGPWKKEALKRGYASVIALPIMYAGEAIGSLAVYSDRTGVFEKEEINFLTEVAGDIALGVRTIRMEKRLERSLEHLQKAMNNTVEAIAHLCETRDLYTAGHQIRVAKLACAIGRKMGFDAERIEGIRVTASLHDIGKVSVPSEILNKPGRLSSIEFDIIKTHPQVAYNVLKNLYFPWPVALSILQHHERMDGSGYPEGTSGSKIILEARIIAVADVVEAMCSHRPYRAALGIDVAIGEISQKKGILYDADVVDACLVLFKKEGFEFDKMSWN